MSDQSRALRELELEDCMVWRTVREAQDQVMNSVEQAQRWSAIMRSKTSQAVGELLKWLENGSVFRDS